MFPADFANGMDENQLDYSNLRVSLIDGNTID